MYRNVLAPRRLRRIMSPASPDRSAGGDIIGQHWLGSRAGNRHPGHVLPHPRLKQPPQLRRHAPGPPDLRLFQHPLPQGMHLNWSFSFETSSLE